MEVYRREGAQYSCGGKQLTHPVPYNSGGGSQSVCVYRVLSGRLASIGEAPALEDPSESLVAEGPAEDELVMGAVFAI